MSDDYEDERVYVRCGCMSPERPRIRCELGEGHDGDHRCEILNGNASHVWPPYGAIQQDEHCPFTPCGLPRGHDGARRLPPIRGQIFSLTAGEMEALRAEGMRVATEQIVQMLRRSMHAGSCIRSANSWADIIIVEMNSIECGEHKEQT